MQYSYLTLKSYKTIYMDVNYKKYNIVITHQKLKKQFMLMYDIYSYLTLKN